jgi:hypothetical protein
MPRATTPDLGTAAKKPRRPHLHIMVVQRLSEGVGPGPIHVFKKVLNDATVGPTVKQVRVPVPLDHTLPAGTGALTAADRRAFADEGLSPPEIAYVESKLPEKKVKSDAHKATFEAGKALRLRTRLKERLIAQLSKDPDLAAGVIFELSGPLNGATTVPAPNVDSLSAKVSRLLALMDEVGRDIEAYKDAAKVGKTFDKDKLRVMLTKEAERDWKLGWFAFSRMVERATGTPFARSKDWRRDPENSQLAATHGYTFMDSGDA